MMKHTHRCIIAVFTVFIFIQVLTGCWSRKELNEISVILAIGIDYIDGQYEVTIQTVDSSQLSANKIANRSPTFIVSEKADSVFEAIRESTTKASRRMYGAHLRMLIVNEKMAKHGINEALELLLRDPEIRPDFYISIAKDCTAKDILAMMTPFEVLTGMELYKSLKVSQKAWAPTAAIRVTELFQMEVNEGIEPALTGLTMIGDREKGKSQQNVSQPTTYGEYKYIGLAAFRGEKLAGWLNESDSKAYS